MGSGGVGWRQAGGGSARRRGCSGGGRRQASGAWRGHRRSGAPLVRLDWGAWARKRLYRRRPQLPNCCQLLWEPRLGPKSDKLWRISVCALPIPQGNMAPYAWPYRVVVFAQHFGSYLPPLRRRWALRARRPGLGAPRVAHDERNRGRAARQRNTSRRSSSSRNASGSGSGSAPGPIDSGPLRGSSEPLLPERSAFGQL